MVCGPELVSMSCEISVFVVFIVLLFGLFVEFSSDFFVPPFSMIGLHPDAVDEPESTEESRAALYRLFHQPNDDDDDPSNAPIESAVLMSARRVRTSMFYDLRLMRAVVKWRPFTCAHGKTGGLWESVALDVNNELAGFMPASSCTKRAKKLLDQGAKAFHSGTEEETATLKSDIATVLKAIQDHQEKIRAAEVARAETTGLAKSFVEVGVQRLKERREASKSTATAQASPVVTSTASELAPTYLDAETVSTKSTPTKKKSTEDGPPAGCKRNKKEGKELARWRDDESVKSPDVHITCWEIHVDRAFFSASRTCSFPFSKLCTVSGNFSRLDSCRPSGRSEFIKARSA